MRSLLALALIPALVSAGIFPKDSLVTMLDPKGFKQVMKGNDTSMIAFVAPWCGHCQRMTPEFSKAALGLHPLIPFYAVDCDDDKNKRLCAEQGVQGFPTVKMFPKGGQEKSSTYEGERSASAFYYYVTRRIPPTFTKLYKTEDLIPWIEKTVDQKRTLLLTKDKKVPLLWKILSNKYEGRFEFGTHRDRKGKSSVALGFEAGEKKDSKVLVYSPGSTVPFRYEGLNKFESLSKFFDSVLDGTADLTVANAEAKAEEAAYEPTEEELEIERKQEAQRMALLHGGFADLIDFEQAILNGATENYHDTHGFGSAPMKKKATEEGDKPAEGEKAAEEAKPTEAVEESKPVETEEVKTAKDEAEL